MLAYFYSNHVKDSIRINQVENFASQLVNSAESVFFAGEPSKSTISLYLPEGVEEISIMSDAVIITTKVSGGVQNKRAFSSKVRLNGTITPSEGIKNLVLEAKSDHVEISKAS
jgi:hypothetical protein